MVWDLAQDGAGPSTACCGGTEQHGSWHSVESWGGVAAQGGTGLGMAHRPGGRQAAQGFPGHPSASSETQGFPCLKRHAPSVVAQDQAPASCGSTGT